MLHACRRLALALAAVNLVACGEAGQPAERGSQKVINQRHALKGVKQVACELPIQLRLMQGEPEGLSLTADDNLMPWLVVAMVGPELRLSWKDKAPDFRDFTLKGQLLLKDPELVNLSGAADLEATALNLPRFTFVGTGASQARFGGRMGHWVARASGAAQVHAEGLRAEAIQVEGSGAARLNLRVHDALQGELSGSAGLKAQAEATRRVALALSGASEALVWPTEELVATASGASTLHHQGQPKRKQVETSGSAEVAEAEAPASPSHP